MFVCSASQEHTSAWCKVCTVRQSRKVWELSRIVTILELGRANCVAARFAAILHATATDLELGGARGAQHLPCGCAPVLLISDSPWPRGSAQRLFSPAPTPSPHSSGSVQLASFVSRPLLAPPTRRASSAGRASWLGALLVRNPRPGRGQKKRLQSANQAHVSNMS